MDAKKLLIASSVTLLVAGALAADATSASIDALKANVGNTAGLEVDEVRVTDDGVACIEYRVSNSQGRKTRGHAVVKGEEVLKSSSDYERFEKAWNEHCLGPRGGITGGE